MFLLLKGDLIKRFDSIYYQPSESLRIVKKSIYVKKKLSEITELQRGRFSHRPRNDPKFYDGIYPFIQTGDVVKASNEGGEIIFTQTLNLLGLSVSKLFEANILVMTIAANIGDTAILTYPACFPDSVVTIKPKIDDLDIRYLNIFLKLIKPYLNEIAPQSAQKNINIQQLSPIPIVVPPIEIQQTIINIFKNAYAIKKEKEAQAKSLLASIDEYLLKELGISLPDKQENFLKYRVFLRNISEVGSGRFDAFYYKDEFEKLRKILSKCKNIIRLDSIIDIITKGETPSGEGNNYISDGIPFLRVQNISIEGIKKDLMFISKEVHNKMNRSKLFGGEILFTIAGSVGVVTLFPDNFGESNINQAIAKITLKKNISVNKNYIIEILNSSVCKQQIKKFLTVSAQPNINFDQIKSIEIPLPPLEIQEKIVNHIQSIRDKAKALENEAKEIIEQAKVEVEKMILGE